MKRIAKPRYRYVRSSTLRTGDIIALPFSEPGYGGRLLFVLDRVIAQRICGKNCLDTSFTTFAARSQISPAFESHLTFERDIRVWKVIHE